MRPNHTKARFVLPLLIATAVAVAGAHAVAAGPRGERSDRPVAGGLRPAQLLKLADAVAVANGDRHPYDIEAVRTTRGAAGAVIWPGAVDDADPTPVYAITMRGRFTAHNASTPLVGESPAGSVISAVIGATGRLRGQGLDFNLTTRPEPDLAELGAVQKLK
jgi:hypothetical protein